MLFVRYNIQEFIVDEMANVIAKNLKWIRQSRNMSLDQLAEVTGVSKSMLGQIERGVSSPTIQTLWKISSGLGVNFTYLIQSLEEDIRIERFQDKTPIVGDHGRFRIYSEWQSKDQELIYIEMDPGARSESSPHVKGTREHLLVNQGSVKLTLDQEVFVMEQGDTANYFADKPHIYENPTQRLSSFTMLISYTRRKEES